jgi:hypothetical protein
MGVPHHAEHFQEHRVVAVRVVSHRKSHVLTGSNVDFDAALRR